MLRLNAVRKPLLLLSVLAAGALAQPAYFARGIAGLASYGDGGPARNARVIQPVALTADAGGNIYIAEGIGTIRRVAPDGTISTLAGVRTGSASGDNGPAAAAGFTTITGIVASGNHLYISQRAPCQIRRIDLSTRIISNFAGTGACEPGADGPAAATALDSPGALAVDWQGRIYVTERTRVRRIDPGTGLIAAFAGDGTAGFGGDGGPAVGAQLNNPLGVAVDAQGAVYISDTGNCRIRRVVPASGYIFTVAGSGACGNGGDGGLAIQAQLAGVGALAIDATGSELYMASGGTVRRYSLTTGMIDRFAGTGAAGAVRENIPALEAALWTVSSVHVDGSGRVLFADAGANRVGRISSNGVLTGLAGALTFAGDGLPSQYALLTMPTDVLPEPGGTLLISESINRRIRRLSAQNILSTVAGTGAPGGASGNAGPALNASLEPGALARDASGNIYTVDALSNTVRKIGTNRAISQVGPVFDSLPGGIAVDASELFLYISDTGRHRIVRVSLSTGDLTVFAGTGTAGFAGDGGPGAQAQFRSPMRIAFDADGALYVADSGNHRIRRISADGGLVETVAGNGLADGSGDGNRAAQASLPSPTGVSVDSEGNIFTNNAVAVYRIDRVSGVLHRIAGQGSRGNSELGRPALQAAFNVVGNVAVNSLGTVYLAESLNLRVVALTPSTSPRPAITSAIAPGAFGAGDTIAPNGWIEIYGEKLASVTRQWTPNDFNGLIAPRSLGGVRVLVQGQEAFIHSVSPSQINAVVPGDVVAGNGIATIEVVNAGGTSETVSILAAQRAGYLLAPPLFARDGKQYIVAFFQHGGGYAGPPGLLPGTNVRPAKPGNRLTLYGVGFGPVAPEVLEGNLAAGPNSLPNVRVTVGGVEAIVEYAGLAVGYVGLYQFDIIVPTAPVGDNLLEITVNGQRFAQTLYLTVN